MVSQRDRESTHPSAEQIVIRRADPVAARVVAEEGWSDAGQLTVQRDRTGKTHVGLARLAQRVQILLVAVSVQLAVAQSPGSVPVAEAVDQLEQLPVLGRPELLEVPDRAEEELAGPGLEQLGPAEQRRRLAERDLALRGSAASSSVYARQQKLSRMDAGDSRARRDDR